MIIPFFQQLRTGLSTMEKKAGATSPKQGSKSALGKKANLRDMQESEIQAEFKQAIVERLTALSPAEAYKMWQQKQLSLVHFSYLNADARFLIVWGIDSPNKPSSLLAELSSDPEESVRKAIIHNPNTPAVSLAQLAKDKRYLVREATIANPNTPLTSLKLLAKDEHPLLRRKVCENMNTPAALLGRLAEDKDKGVRTAVASNLNTPKSALKLLSEDGHDDVRIAVASNPSTPKAILGELAGDDMQHSVRQAVAGNPNTNSTTLLLLAEYDIVDLNIILFDNPSTPKRLLKRLLSYLEYRTDSDVPYTLAASLNTPMWTLDWLAEDNYDNDDICIAIAMNPNTSSETLTTLAEHSIDEDVDISIRCAVAKNPKTSKLVLQTLAGEQHKKVRSSIVLNPQCPNELLIELCHDTNISMEAKEAAIKKLNFPDDILSLPHFHLVLQTSDIPEQVLMRLEQHENSEVSLAACSNPLHPNFTKSLIETPKTNALFIRWVNEADKAVQSAVGSDNVFFFAGEGANKAAVSKSALVRVLAISDSTSVEPALLDESQEHSDWLVRMSIAANIGTPINTLHKLKQDSHALVAKQAEITIVKIRDKPETELLDEEARQSYLSELFKDIAVSIKSKHHQIVAIDDPVWGHCLNLQLLWDPSRIHEVTEMWTDDEWQLFGEWILSLEPKALAPYLTSEAIVAFAVKHLKHEKASLIYLESHPLCTEASLNDLSKSKYLEVREAVANNSNTSSVALTLLAKDRSSLVRSSVAANPNTPMTSLKLLAKDEYDDVREAVARNPNTSKVSLRLLAKDLSYFGFFIREAVAANPNTSEASLELLARDKKRLVCATVAANPSTPVVLAKKLLLMLAKDKDDDVRETVAQSPHLPDKLLTLLANDVGHHVRGAVAENLVTPAELLSLLAMDGDWWVRRCVALNPNTPKELLKLLANDVSHFVRGAVAKNLVTPAELLSLLAKDEDIEVRLDVAGNINTPSELLKLLTEDEHSAVRKSVARNSNTPKESLKLLTKDKDEWVRSGVPCSAVTENPKTPKNKLETTSSNKYAFLESLSLAEYKEHIRIALSPDIRLPTDITTLDIRRGVESLGLLREEIGYEELTKMRISMDRLQRVAVCFHDKVTENLLSILSEDKDVAVAEIAKEMFARIPRIQQSFDR
jgi:hypothetical protein